MTSARRAATLAIGGPTATGKTALAVELARRTGAELVNADSRQVLRRLAVGTARPAHTELRGVRCHLLDLVEPGEEFTVAAWLLRAQATLEALDRRRVPAVVVGGTGQYLRALRQGWTFGAPPRPEQRAELTRAAATSAGMARLVAELRDRDPDAAAAIDVANPRRVVRAVEVLRAGGGALTAARAPSGGRPLALVVLDADPDVHDAAIAARMEAMFGSGAILDEVRDELDRGVAPGALRRAGIGYGEALDVLERLIDVPAAAARAEQRTRRYVKAQRTWFRHEPARLRLCRRAGDTPARLADAVEAGLATPG